MAERTLMSDFLGSAHVFALAVSTIIDEKLLAEAVGSELTFSQLKLLKLISETDCRTVGDVASFFGVSNAAASKAVDRLVRRMLLRRNEGEDRRSIRLSLTDPGRRLLAAYDSVRERRLAETFEGIPPDDLRRTAEFLDQLSARVVGHG